MWEWGRQAVRREGRVTLQVEETGCSKSIWNTDRRELRLELAEQGGGAWDTWGAKHRCLLSSGSPAWQNGVWGSFYLRTRSWPMMTPSSQNPGTMFWEPQDTWGRPCDLTQLRPHLMTSIQCQLREWVSQTSSPQMAAFQAIPHEGRTTWLSPVNPQNCTAS